MQIKDAAQSNNKKSTKGRQKRLRIFALNKHKSVVIKKLRINLHLHHFVQATRLVFCPHLEASNINYSNSAEIKENSEQL